MDFKLTGRRWYVEVRLAPGEAPDTKKSYTEQVLRPEQVNITFSQAADGRMQSSSVVVGRRVLKSGGLGDTIRDGYVPADWLRDVIAQAQMRLGGLERRS